MGDHGAGRIVTAGPCDCDGRFSCGDDVGVAVHRLVHSFIRGRRDCDRVATASIPRAHLIGRRAGCWKLFRGDGRWQRDLHPDACRQLNVSSTGDPTVVSLCHRPQCQRQTGSSFGIAAFFSLKNVRATGQTKSFSHGSDSGHSLTIHFCCTTVYWEPHRKPMRSVLRSERSLPLRFLQRRNRFTPSAGILGFSFSN